MSSGWPAGRTQQNKAGEILGVVLDVISEDDAAIVFGGAAAGDGRATPIAAGERFAHAASCIFRRHAFDARVGEEETFALSKSHGMRGYGTDGIKRRTGTANEAMLNREDNFRDYAEVAADKEVIDPDNGTCEGVFDGCQNSIGPTFLDGTKS